VKENPISIIFHRIYLLSPKVIKYRNTKFSCKYLIIKKRQNFYCIFAINTETNPKYKLMCNLLKKLKGLVVSFLGIIIILFSIITETSAQVLVAGTQFTPISPTTGKTYYGITDISQYGMITGAISVTPPLTPNTTANVFNGSAYYAITTNPDTLDNVRYENLPAATNYMLALSPPSFASGGTLLSYTVSGLAVGSNVSVIVTYCNLEQTTNAACVGQSYPLKGVINPNQYNTTNGDNTTTQVSSTGTRCATYTWTQASGSSQVVQPGGQAVFNLNQAQGGSCEAMGISKIEIYGTPAPTISSTAGSQVCTGEQTILQLGQAYQGATYQWQISTNNGTSFSNIAGATNSSYLLTAAASGTSYQYQLQVTYSGTIFTSNAATVSSVTCCTAGGSRQTVYYNDFGTFDLVGDPTGKTYYTWDYTNYLNPVLVKNTTTTPFSYPLSTAPPGTTYISGGPVNNDEYTVAAGLNGYQSYTYPGNGVTYATGSGLQWAANIEGNATQPAVTFDHSGNYEGAALLINIPPNSKGDVIYSNTINNLCGGKSLYFQAWITVFTSSAPGTYHPVNVLVKLIDGSNAANFYIDSATTTAVPFGGCGCWVEITGQLTLGAGSTSMIFQLIENQNDDANGDDLVLDDISVLACSPPSANAVFDLTALSTSTTVCSNNMNIYGLSSTATAYYGTPYYLFQYSYTPTDNTSWVSLGSPQASSTYTMTSPKSNTIFTSAPTLPVYFRVIVATQATLNAGGTFSQSAVCENYSVSSAISATPSCPLSVKLISFTGNKQSGSNILTWSTSSEQNNDYFLIERSSNGTDFTVIGRVNGSGNSSIIQNYRFSDNSPTSGTNYYRLEQVDFNGNSNYSNAIVITNTNANISVYPNPNNGSFEIYIADLEQSYSLTITDLQGRQVYTIADTTNSGTIKINNLPQGFYIVQINLADQVMTTKVSVY